MKFWFLVLLPAFVGCATPAHQSEALLRNPPNVARSAEVKDVPFIAQAKGDCGPTTLAMVMQWTEHPISPEELTPKVLTPGKAGSLQNDLISASRREGLLAIPIDGLPRLLEEVNGGHPAIVFLNLGLSWYPIWHYAVVIGYDLDKRELVMHSGAERAKHVSLKEFERSWELAGYWALLVLPPTKLAATADELSQMRAAAGLEQAGRPTEAKLAYNTTLARWPSSLPAMIGLGNLAFKAGEYSDSVRILEKAVRLHPDSEIARNNLQVATSALGQKRSN